MMYEEQVKRLRYKASKLNYNGWVDTAVSLEEAADTIEKLIKVIQNHNFLKSLIKPYWIPVTDHTPKYSGYYLVCDNDDDVYTAYFGNTTKNWWTEKVVTYWMPRPEPPKEG